MLSSSVDETGRVIDFSAVGDVARDPGVAGGAELVALGRAAVETGVDSTPTETVADIMGAKAAVRAAAVAGAFELYNRIVDATGLPVGRVQRDALADIIEALGLNTFPHARHGLRPND
jgi:hypothetical protein